MSKKQEAKEALNKLIKKSKSRYYKPTQIAEILYHNRIFNDLDILNLEEYRIESKIWRNKISEILVGSICTSSSKYQDDLFNENAIPPRILKILDEENRVTNGAVENYIYQQFKLKYSRLYEAYEYCKNSNFETFNVEEFINMFWDQPSLRSSIDKIYEIIVYSLFKSLVEILELKVEISIPESHLNILDEFQDFSDKVMNLNINNRVYTNEASFFRVGTTNASDRGIDIYSNWGPSIQIKHLSLNTKLTQEIIDTIPGDKIIIVCKDIDKDIQSLLYQIGWTNRIQSIITEKELFEWYHKALKGKYSDLIGDKILKYIQQELILEFPFLETTLENPLSNRNYDEIHDSFWQ